MSISVYVSYTYMCRVKGVNSRLGISEVYLMTVIEIIQNETEKEETFYFLFFKDFIYLFDRDHK